MPDAHLVNGCWVAGSLMLAVMLALRGFKKQSLSASGAVAAVLVGSLHMSAGLPHGAVLLFFFFSSSKLTRMGSAAKAQREDGHKEGGQRTAAQVLANSTWACAAILTQLLWRSQQPERLQQACTWAFLAHYACVTADTWASEIGILASTPPCLITVPWRHVPPGTNGGVSAQGLAASLAGGMCVALVWVGSVAAAQWLGPARYGGLLEADEGASIGHVIMLCGAAGMWGSLCDSLLGATLQFSGWDEERRVVVGRPGPGVKRISGVNLLSNGAVNLLASMVLAGVGAAAPLMMGGRIRT